MTGPPLAESDEKGLFAGDRGAASARATERPGPIAGCSATNLETNQEIVSGVKSSEISASGTSWLEKARFAFDSN